jgi:hypothetical protein
MQRFVDTITGGGRPSMSFEEISAVTRTCLLAVAAQKTGTVYDV